MHAFLRFPGGSIGWFYNANQQRQCQETFATAELAKVNTRHGLELALEVPMRSFLIIAAFIAMAVAPAFAALNVFTEKNRL
jgi:hypothetical protein